MASARKIHSSREPYRVSCPVVSCLNSEETGREVKEETTRETTILIPRKKKKRKAMGNCSCFGPSKAERKEADRVESEDARAKAAEAAQKR